MVLFAQLQLTLRMTKTKNVYFFVRFCPFIPEKKIPNFPFKY